MIRNIGLKGGDSLTERRALLGCAARLRWATIAVRHYFHAAHSEAGTIGFRTVIRTTTADGTAQR